MPYIKDERRKALWSESSTDFNSDIENAGELNYFITTICHDYLNHKGECYQTYNDIIGALEGAKLELYRRKVAIYENRKMLENGDV